MTGTLHSAVHEAGEGAKRTYMLPPLTLLKVVKVQHTYTHTHH
jgi:hypothetical protein